MIVVEGVEVEVVVEGEVVMVVVLLLSGGGRRVSSVKGGGGLFLAPDTAD